MRLPIDTHHLSQLFDDCVCEVLWVSGAPGERIRDDDTASLHGDAQPCAGVPVCPDRRRSQWARRLDLLDVPPGYVPCGPEVAYRQPLRRCDDRQTRKAGGHRCERADRRGTNSDPYLVTHAGGGSPELPSQDRQEYQCWNRADEERCAERVPMASIRSASERDHHTQKYTTVIMQRQCGGVRCVGPPADELDQSCVRVPRRAGVLGVVVGDSGLNQRVVEAYLGS